ncbi:hypothetical protein FQA47_002685 [Oryzias melastigma]|uniref:Uncharacterized protein n=1 Tax=Oryzias melastigma TaxID=30732 RepID=A0A834BTH7_ORYME|nr:hypothetical protein FQA47_002685 [Oryzias melastigma]
MAVLQTAFFILILMTATQSKPVYQNVEADSSKSSESDSSEEDAAQALQPELTGTAMPHAVEEGDSLEAEQEQEEAEVEEAEEAEEVEEVESSTDTAQDIEVPLNGSNPEAAGLQLLPDAEASSQPHFDVNDCNFYKRCADRHSNATSNVQNLTFYNPHWSHPCWDPCLLYCAGHDS